MDRTQITRTGALRRLTVIVGAGAIAATLVAGAASAAPSMSSGPGGRASSVRPAPTPTTVRTSPRPSATPIPATLTAEQAATLAAMAEEEQLARDLYTAFGTLYASPVWARTASAEATHLSAIRTLLVRYGIPDPTTDGYAPGYDALYAQGVASEVAAFGVGRWVELDDIARLETALASTGLPRDVMTVYSNLLAASRQHLSAFESLLAL